MILELVDMSVNESLGEIPDVKAASVTFPVRGMDQADFTLSLDNRFADRVFETRDYLFIYDNRDDPDRDPIFAGPIVDADEKGSSNSIAVNCPSPLWSLATILIGKAADLNYNATDRTEIIRGIMTLSIAEANSFIRNGVIAGASGDADAGPWRYKPSQEALLEITNTLGGPEFWLEYLRPGQSDGSGAKIAEFNAKPARSVDRTEEVFFEYGTGKRNLREYGRRASRDGLITRAHVLPVGFPQTTENVAVFQDATLENIYNFGEAVVPSDIGSYDLRYSLAQTQVDLRKQPRRVYVFEPYRVDSPRFKVDYDVGDLVTGRAVKNGKIRFDAAFRIYQQKFDKDELGKVTPSVEVVPS